MILQRVKNSDIKTWNYLYPGNLSIHIRKDISLGLEWEDLESGIKHVSFRIGRIKKFYNVFTFFEERNGKTHRIFKVVAETKRELEYLKNIATSISVVNKINIENID